MSDVMTSEGLDLIFRNARTHNAWLDKPVEDTLLNQVYDLAKMGPTSANMCPMRIIFVKTQAAKERLKPALDPGNVDKTMAAPVTVATEVPRVPRRTPTARRPRATRVPRRRRPPVTEATPPAAGAGPRAATPTP